MKIKKTLNLFHKNIKIIKGGLIIPVSYFLAYRVIFEKEDILPYGSISAIELWEKGELLVKPGKALAIAIHPDFNEKINRYDRYFLHIYYCRSRKPKEYDAFITMTDYQKIMTDYQKIENKEEAPAERFFARNAGYFGEC